MIVKIQPSLQKPTKIILGIDPGTLMMGYSIIEVCGNLITLIEMNVLKLSAKKDNYQRLQLIHQKVIYLAKKYHPNELAIEAPFFGKNVQSMLKLGRAQGVAIAAAMSAGIPVTEYSPKKIKQSITGNGNSDKEKIWKMLQHILVLGEKPNSFDATDALAVAICHCFQFNGIVDSTLKKNNPKNKNNWENFVAHNPTRIKR
jgi:crossover junction endodeoxyribonuclease RuvC